MTRFIPDKGTHFYTKCKPYPRVIGDPFGFTATKEQVVTQQDGSYSSEVILCLGRDDHAVVGQRSTGMVKQILLPFDKWEFYPVGPEVLAALGITEESA